MYIPRGFIYKEEDSVCKKAVTDLCANCQNPKHEILRKHHGVTFRYAENEIIYNSSST